MTFRFHLPLGDAALVRRALADDSRAFEELIRRYQRKVHAVARAQGVPADSVDDVVQEAFLEAFRGLTRLRAHESFGPWLLQIARNAGLKARRGLERSRMPVLEDSFEASPEQGLEGSELNDLLWRKVSELPDDVRETVLLYYHDGESVRGIARALGVSSSIVKNRLKKGRDILRERLWRRLGECLRDMLPSTRQWEGRARRLALLAIAAAPAAWGRNAAAAVTASATGTTFDATLGASIMISKKTVISVALAAAVLVTCGSWILFRPVLQRSRDAAAIASKATAPSPAAGSTRPAPAAERAATGESKTESKTTAAVEASPVSVEGRVLDPAGSAVPRARLIALDVRAWRAAGARAREGKASSQASAADLAALRTEYLRIGEAAPRAESDLSGRFTLRGLAAGEYRLVVTREGFLPSAETVVTVRAGAPEKRDVVLAHARQISGTVLDAEGNAVAGARVRAEPSDLTPVPGNERVERTLAAWSDGLVLAERADAETSSAGSFQIDALEPVLHDVTARKEGYLPGTTWHVAAGARDVRVSLSRGGGIAGRVVDEEGKPALAGEVRVTPARSAEIHRYFDAGQNDADPLEERTRRIPLTAQGGGRFRADGLADGAYVVEVSSGAHPLLVREAEVAGAVADTGDLSLETPRAIAGIVLDPQGQPAPGARVWVPRVKRSAMPSNRIPIEEPEALASATSGPGGRFLLEGLPAGDVEVRAALEGFADGAARVAAGAKDVKVSLAEGLSVFGKVVDADSGAPVPDAEVKLGIGTSRKARTGPDGRFEARGVPPAALFRSRLYMTITHPDYGSQPCEASAFGHGEDSPIEVRLARNGRLRGRVVDSSGEGIGGARVSFALEGLPPEAFGYDPTGGAAAYTEDDGSFAINAPNDLRRMVSGIRLFAVARHPGHAPGRVGPIPLPPPGAPWPDVDIALGAGGAIEGSVTGPGGKPVAGARVAARSGEGPAAAGASDPSTFSGPDGSYRIRGLAAGRHEVRASAIGLAPKAAGEVTVGEGSTRLDIALEAGAAIDGRVVDTSGNAIPGADVEAFAEALAPVDDGDDGSDFAKRMLRLRVAGIASARTGAHGRFQLAPMPEGKFTLLARAPGFEPETVAGVPAGFPAPDIRLGRFSALRGTVLAADTRAPISSFRIDVVNKARRKALSKSSGFRDPRLGTEGEMVFANTGGKFVYDGLRPAEYEVSVIAAGFRPRTLDVAVEAGEEQPVEVLLERGAAVEGVVVDADTGRPIAGASVSCSQKRSTPDYGLDMRRQLLLGDIVTGADGAFSIGGLEEEEYSFSASHPLYVDPARGGEGQVKAVLSASEVARVEVRLTPAGMLEGEVLGVDEKKSDERNVSAWLACTPVEEGAGADPRAPDLWSRRIYLDPDGRFHQEQMRPGRYRLELKTQAVKRGKTVHLGPQGGFGMSTPDGPEETIPLGEVEITAGRVTAFHGRMPKG